MDITPQCVVALTWTLKDTLGEVLDELDSPVEFLVGGTDLLPRIEQALQGHAKGARLQLSLEPQDAFGDFDERLIFLQPRTLFPQGLEKDILIEASALPSGIAMPADRIYTVTDIYPDHVVLDGNHPLAGIGLRLDLRVHDVREATAEPPPPRRRRPGLRRPPPLRRRGPRPATPRPIWMRPCPTPRPPRRTSTRP